MSLRGYSDGGLEFLADQMSDIFWSNRMFPDIVNKANPVFVFSVTDDSYCFCSCLLETTNLFRMARLGSATTLTPGSSLITCRYSCVLTVPYVIYIPTRWAEWYVFVAFLHRQLFCGTCIRHSFPCFLSLQNFHLVPLQLVLGLVPFAHVSTQQQYARVPCRNRSTCASCPRRI